MKKIIVVAGATGNLGFRIVRELLKEGAEVRALVRASSDQERIAGLENMGAGIFCVDRWDAEALQAACNRASCVVSALAGLRDVVIDAQTVLLDAAIAAGVPRFIPTDYSLNFTSFTYGENRNLDLRREFHKYLDHQPIAAISIFNGAFTELLTNEMPMILFRQRMILYWGNADHRWGFTTLDNTATYTAKVALDSSSPRYLNIAGDLISPREVSRVMHEITGQTFRLFRPGGKKLLGFMIKLVRKMAPGKNELYPAWQGMQYMHNMIDERSTIDKPDNDRYPGIRWTTVKDILASHKFG